MAIRMICCNGMTTEFVLSSFLIRVHPCSSVVALFAAWKNVLGAIFRRILTTENRNFKGSGCVRRMVNHG